MANHDHTGQEIMRAAEEYVASMQNLYDAISAALIAGGTLGAMLDEHQGVSQADSTFCDRGDIAEKAIRDGYARLAEMFD